MISLPFKAHVTQASDLIEQYTDNRFSLTSLSGRLVELSARGASALLSSVVPLLLDAQQKEEPCAWLTSASGMFFPPDLARAGVDLGALVIVRASFTDRLRAAERLLQSGGFGLLVIDSKEPLTEAAPELSLAQQSRLAGLCKQHGAALVLLTDKPEGTASMGSLISLHARALRTYDHASMRATIRATKDKQRGPGWQQELTLQTPPGVALG